MLDAFRLLTTEISTNQKQIIMNKLKYIAAVVCVLMLAFSHNASAAPQLMPPVVSVPDGGATIMLLGAALGALGMARRFLKI
jgi:hypothetical protein